MATTDFTKTMQDFMGAFSVDPKAMQDAFKSPAALSEKMSKVYLDAAQKSTDISSKWTKATLAKVGDVATVKEDPADYSKSISDFASSSVEMASEHLSAFAEIAKRVQMDTVELMLAAGKDMSAEASAAVQKATKDAAAAAKKVAAPAK
ncbi:phasin family protein [Pararhodobacter sp.]|uniref:phasin family protein n=1 Tax=Pararhodobacter sp. TaxID=2127056 RepID=UPI002AFFCECB|nr:phasin family protein [Pararhodobacter sp.]